MASYSTAHYLDLGQRLQSLYWEHYSVILGRYPESKFGVDTRPALFAMPGNALVGYVLAMGVLETTLLKTDWWAQHTPYRTEADIKERLQHYEGTIRQSFFVIFASRYEWVIRNILANLDATVAEGGLGKYKAVYDALLTCTDNQDLTVTFDVARELRNTLHNNGVYCSPKRRDSAAYLYRGQELRFRHGKSVDMATELSFQLMEDLIIAARQIVDSSPVAGLAKAPFTLTTGESADPRAQDV